mmetsp:Transcript_33249/g.116599  ORF Transcript_33249/g.116599 Transcript_33249/m.116599 type:complete len:342 (+) Transcript_33249:1209-2234(+)
MPPRRCAARAARHRLRAPPRRRAQPPHRPRSRRRLRRRRRRGGAARRRLGRHRRRAAEAAVGRRQRLRARAGRRVPARLRRRRRFRARFRGRGFQGRRGGQRSRLGRVCHRAGPPHKPPLHLHFGMPPRALRPRAPRDSPDCARRGRGDSQERLRRRRKRKRKRRRPLRPLRRRRCGPERSWPRRHRPRRRLFRVDGPCGGQRSHRRPRRRLGRRFNCCEGRGGASHLLRFAQHIPPPSRRLRRRPHKVSGTWTGLLKSANHPRLALPMHGDVLRGRPRLPRLGPRHFRRRSATVAHRPLRARGLGPFRRRFAHSCAPRGLVHRSGAADAPRRRRALAKPR